MTITMITTIITNKKQKNGRFKKFRRAAGKPFRKRGK